MSKLKHVLRYLQGTKGFRHQLRPFISLPAYEKSSIDILAYVDSDWAGCHKTRRSTSGGVLQMPGSTFHHFSRTQATVALSSAEAELYAITSGVAKSIRFQVISSRDRAIHNNKPTCIHRFIIRQVNCFKRRHFKENKTHRHSFVVGSRCFQTTVVQEFKEQTLQGAYTSKSSRRSN
jgi:hypothetical protein